MPYKTHFKTYLPTHHSHTYLLTLYRHTYLLTHHRNTYLLTHQCTNLLTRKDSKARYVGASPNTSTLFLLNQSSCCSPCHSPYLILLDVDYSLPRIN